MSIVGAACERIAALCRDVAADAADEHRTRLLTTADQLLQPLHVAVAGRVKSGKSTFVNALLGQRVARTDARECTRVVTWFRYGPAERVTVIDRQGGRHLRRLDADGLVPEDLGLPVEQVASVDVELTLARLRSFTLADTPGLDSPDDATSKITEGVLGVDPDSHAAIAAAEAVLFVMNQTVKQSDVDVLRAFRALSLSAGSDVVSAFGVLNKADLFDGPDPMATGAAIAARFSRELRTELAGVFPCSSLFAETALCGLFTEDDAAAVEELAALDSATRERMLLSADVFRRTRHDVPAAARARLWQLLREAGLRALLSAVDGGRSGAVQLRARLLDLSGHSAVDARIVELFEANAPALKASIALDRLEVMAWGSGGAWGHDLRDRIEALRLDPALHVVAEIGALRQVRRGEVTLPDDLADELARLVSTPPHGRTADAAAGLRRWRSHANSAVSPSEAHVARIVVRSYELATGVGRVT
jgi:Dynamin family